MIRERLVAVVALLGFALAAWLVILAAMCGSIAVVWFVVR